MTAKLYALIPRRPDLSDEAFHQHWRTTHADLARRISSLRRYVQSHRLPVHTGLPPSPYEGIAEAYFDDAAAGLAMGEDPEYTEHALKDEPNFMDVPGLAFLVTTEEVIEEGPPRGPEAVGVKLLQLVRRPAGTDHASWREELLAADHVAVGNSLRAERHVIALCVPESYGTEGSEPLFDAVRELSWPTLEDFQRARDSAAWARLVDPGLMDEDSVAADVAEEYRVIWPQG
ncbi:EthD domain-containing protein [Pseudonocardia sp. NPDC049154]|uniref:EthD domain-containing protein n=1 Tax=Pseudonocardia sp. NPDC049154 TaxID=3155501 RepID=UPI0033E60713